jgi:hypothetical protein
MFQMTTLVFHFIIFVSICSSLWRGMEINATVKLRQQRSCLPIHSACHQQVRDTCAAFSTKFPVDMLVLTQLRRRTCPTIGSHGDVPAPSRDLTRNPGVIDSEACGTNSGEVCVTSNVAVQRK